MKPSDLSKELKRIASAIEASKNPSKELVARDIKQLISKIANESSVEEKDPAGELAKKLVTSGVMKSGTKDTDIRPHLIDVMRDYPQGKEAIRALVDALTGVLTNVK